jgi:hypothetical protein
LLEITPCGIAASRFESSASEFRNGDESSVMLEFDEIAWAASDKHGRHHILVARDGRRIVITDEFGQAADIARAVDKEVVSRLLPTLRARLAALDGCTRTSSEPRAGRAVDAACYVPRSHG